MCLLFFFGAPLLAFSEVIEKRNLETLEDDNLKQSLVRALSADGKIAAGVSDTDSGVKHVFISRISRSVPAPVEAPQPAPIAPQALQPTPIVPQAPQLAPIVPQAPQPAPVTPHPRLNRRQ
ncbi:hypothetical protein Rin_00004920 [Candidatus Regiella insecticola 5.15]|uniref:Uncharacterized protein n=2 Tax=Candidatus Regiella insecticola TaxID=138073 RepID=G2GXK0_9ENTR|nr:hypothetical protein Rin_00004920 [Candidatus Regiella insecticola 5.15]